MFDYNALLDFNVQAVGYWQVFGSFIMCGSYCFIPIIFLQMISMFGEIDKKE
ncbi:MAG TPA: hypothetical protein VIK86_03910 [Candidatus Paceibacterota bacterium]